MTLFVSTGGEKYASAIATADIWISKGIENVELSGGSYDPLFEEGLYRLAEQNASITLHNYLPLQSEPFVINLASPNASIHDKSINHVKKCIELSSAIGAKHYAVHAGFLLDPMPRQLGQPLHKVELFDKKACEDRFVTTVKVLGDYAAARNVRLLIENNVYSSSNRRNFPENPLLMTQPDDIADLLNRCSGAAGLLLDVAHLKVSSVSQGFDISDALTSLAPLVEGFHLSDNDGLEDQNYVCTEDSWFWPLLPKVEYYVLEVYGLTICELKEQVMLARAQS